jgi:hypothetical protein
MPTPSIIIVPDRYKSGVLYSQLPESGAVDFDVTRATTAFRTNASGILESVASGVPRLDYPAAGGCPSLLVEPAATNLLLRSEEFDNAYWTKTLSTITANATTAPNAAVTSDKFIEDTSTGAHRLQSSFLTIASGAVHTFSVFAKKSERTKLRLFDVIINSGWDFNIDNGTLLAQYGVAAITPKIENYGNGWFRCSITFTSTSTNARFAFDLLNDAGNNSYLGNGTSGLFLWGAQAETGSVATSYIPTTAATATRNADVISKTGVSGFIGQTQGTLYAEVQVSEFTADRRIVAISNGTSDNRIVLQKGANSTLRGIVTTASGSVADIATASGQTAGVYKIALAYAANDFVLYVNGTQIGTDTSGAVPACSQLFIGKIETSATTNELNDRIRAAAIYTTRLSNTELSALTSL